MNVTPPGESGGGRPSSQYRRRFLRLRCCTCTHRSQEQRLNKSETEFAISRITPAAVRSECTRSIGHNQQMASLRLRTIARCVNGAHLPLPVTLDACRLPRVRGRRTFCPSLASCRCSRSKAINRVLARSVFGRDRPREVRRRSRLGRHPRQWGTRKGGRFIKGVYWHKCDRGRGEYGGHGGRPLLCIAVTPLPLLALSCLVPCCRGSCFRVASEIVGPATTD